MSKFILVMIASLLCSFNGCDSPSSPPPRLLWFVAINSTNHKFTDVAIMGEGYPGRFGNVVPGGRKVMGWYSENLNHRFEVVWRDDEGLHRKSLVLPSNFSLVGGEDLVVEFMADGQIDVYATPRASWDRKE